MKSRSVPLIFLFLVLFNASAGYNPLELLQRGVNASINTFSRDGESNRALAACKTLYPYTPYFFCWYDFYDACKREWHWAEKVMDESRMPEAEQILTDNPIHLPEGFLGIHLVEQYQFPAGFASRMKQSSVIGVHPKYQFELRPSEVQEFLVLHEACHLIENHDAYKKYALLLAPVASELFIQSLNGLRPILEHSLVSIHEGWEPSTNVEWVAKKILLSSIALPISLTHAADTTLGRYVLPEVLLSLLSRFQEIRADLFAVRVAKSTHGIEAYLRGDFRDSEGSMDENTLVGEQPSKDHFHKKYTLFQAVRRYGIRSTIRAFIAPSHPSNNTRIWYSRLYNRYWPAMKADQAISHIDLYKKA